MLTMKKLRFLLPANSHQLCVSLMSVNLRHRSYTHHQRTISHAWPTNLDELVIVLQYMINNEIQLKQFQQKYSKKALNIDFVS